MKMEKLGKSSFEVDRIGKRVRVDASTWGNLFVRYARRWGDEVRADKGLRCALYVVNTERRMEASKKTVEAVERWSTGDLNKALAVGFVLSKFCDYATGDNVKEGNVLLNGLLGYETEKESPAKTARDVLDVHGWVERQSMGNNIHGVEKPSTYRLTVPAALFTLMKAEPDDWLPGSETLDKFCLTVAERVA